MSILNAEIILQERSHYQFEYTNYRGEKSRRQVMFHHVWFGKTEYHPEPQWMVRAFDLEKKDNRDFALADIEPGSLKRCAPYANTREGEG